MSQAGFWQDKLKAQEGVKELNTLKEELAGKRALLKGPAIVTIFSGAGGDDAEDFSRMLFEMYQKFVAKRGWDLYLIHQNENDHGGFRNITFEVTDRFPTGSTSSPQASLGQGPYGILKNESGVHRLVRVSPFSAKKLRHTSFSMVEVIPKFPKSEKMEIPEEELSVEFARSSGPGGQNVNKRETAVRLTHLPTGLSVHSEGQRSQQANREKALEILKSKLYKLKEEERLAKEKGMYISKTTKIEWGNQIRSYVEHPYKMVKDHRTEAETGDVEAVLNGDLDLFIEAEKNL